MKLPSFCESDSSINFLCEKKNEVDSNAISRKVNVYVAVDFFISVNFCFSFNVLNSLIISIHYHTQKQWEKINYNKKLTTTFILNLLTFVVHVVHFLMALSQVAFTVVYVLHWCWPVA